jgi:hypothetical protein
MNNRTSSHLIFCLTFLVLIIPAFRGSAQVEPPPEAFGTNGTPKAFMRTLNEVEPRTPITKLPFAITNSGSYYLADDLSVGNGATGIVIMANHVDLDLRGFTLRGGTNADYGIHLAEFWQEPLPEAPVNVSIHDGSVVMWNKSGINGSAANDSSVKNVIAYSNGTYGVIMNYRSTIEDCIARRNGTTGILVGSSSVIRNCKIQNNGQDGIYVAGDCAIENCELEHNAGFGITGPAGLYSSTVKDCRVLFNQAGGAKLHWRNTVSGCQIGNNLGHGIVAEKENHIVENSIHTHWNLAAIRLSGDHNRVENNSIVGCSTGVLATATADRNLIVGNSAFNCTVGFSVSTSNALGKVMTLTDSTNGLENTGPWVNFEF